MNNPNLKSHRFGVANPHEFNVSGWILFFFFNSFSLFFFSFSLFTPIVYNRGWAGGGQVSKKKSTYISPNSIINRNPKGIITQLRLY